MRTLSLELPGPVFDEAAPLAPEQITKTRQAQAEIARGDSLTDEEVGAHFTRKRAV